jgi:hypothetical protein
MKKWEVRASQFPTVSWVDAKKRNGGIDLIFGTRIDNKEGSLEIRLSWTQWESLKFLIDGPGGKAQSA